MRAALSMLMYAIGQSGQRLVIEQRVLDHFARHQQKRWYQKEAGGQLFARFEAESVILSQVSGPRKTDKRSRFGYEGDRSAERREIEEMYGQGLHYIGDWHTHPEPLPQPSGLDLRSIGECVRKSEHALNAFLLIVVGTAAFPAALCALIHDGSQVLRLLPDSDHPDDKASN